MKKKLLGLVLGVFVLLTMVGCGNNSTSNGGILKDSSNTKGNCSVIECIKKIEPENTVEQINSIIGFDGKLIDEKYNKYYWELSEETGIEVTYYSGKTGTIKVDFDRNSVASSKVNFSKYNSELQPKVRDGITYKEFISYIGNVEGTLIEKSSSSKKYVWVATDGSYLNGTFSNSSDKCTFTSGMIK